MLSAIFLRLPTNPAPWRISIVAQRTMPPGWRAGYGPRILPHTFPSPLVFFIVTARIYGAKTGRQSAHTINSNIIINVIH